MSAISLRTFFLGLLLLQPALAAGLEVPVAEGDRLVLRGLDAQVQLIGAPGSATAGSLKVSGVEDSSLEGAYTLTKKNNIIEVKMNEFAGKRSWLGALPSASTKSKRIEILGPPVPTEVHLRAGSLTAQKWSKDLKVSLTQGRASSVNGTGSLQLYVQKGEVTVVDHKGRVEADSYSGTMTLKSVQGDVEATLFSGVLQLEKVQGFVTLTSQQATAKVLSSGGTLQFENGKGSLNISGFQGRLEGQNQEGSVSIAMNLDTEADVKSKAGRISIQLPAASGAALNLLATEGEISVPSELKVRKLSNEKSVRGRLRGDAQRASVFVRTQEGSISIK